MELIRTFSKLDKTSVAIAGGKGASLGEMAKAGMPVPPGFVVLASAFDRFIQEREIDADIEAILKKTNHKDVNSVDKASAEIRRIILDEKMPKDIAAEILKFAKAEKGKFFAVRSSATAEDSKVASWAGELETYLNVTEKNLIKSVIKCWSSLFTPRAIFYRFEKKLHKQKVSVAVVVQKMVQSEISGISFTVHPVTKDHNQMVIEAGFGLGEAIVGGMVTPDTYVVHKDDFSILDINVSEQSFMIKYDPKAKSRSDTRSGSATGRNINKKLSKSAGGKQKLSGKQIIELAKICKKIEAVYSHPQDIEWAFEKGKFYITQSRPITTL